MAGQLELSLRGQVRALNVTQLVRMVRETLEANLDQCWVMGEVSNARLAPSGHLYFTLKDAHSAIGVVMFRSAAARLRFKVNDGMQAVIRGRVDLYEARGALQFYAEEMEPRGLGALQLAFEQLKERLGREGLFDVGRKRALPFLPASVGIVTALGGAALRDIVTVLLSRYPDMHLTIRPARVQGAGAAAEIAQAIDDLNAGARAEVMIVSRGGGSLEDLWAFNEEVVARAIHRSRIAVVSAVGHEIDYTIADFVADVRAPTPTAAAQLVVPDKAVLRRRVDETAATLNGAAVSALSNHRRAIAQFKSRLREPRMALRGARQRADETAAELSAALAARLGDRRRHVGALGAHLVPPGALVRALRLGAERAALYVGQAMSARLARMRMRVDAMAGRLGEAAPRAMAERRRAAVAAAAVRLGAALERAQGRRRAELAALAARLDSTSPLKVLERGYAVAINLRDGRAVIDAAAVEVGDELDLRLSRGRLRARTIARQS
ncbi:MAG TPA: exodeoxyribonuclease VII large subunit [Candidatus Binataceae bacterium]|nr:exodeoxyribonuclease VII large subunit [Candidatus Binataceae bacterium]